MATLVSLPEHLRQTLLVLLEVPPPPVLTDDLAAQLRPYVVPPRADDSGTVAAKRTIPYSLLSQISKHVRSARCKSALDTHGLDPREYEMISLLAGVQTITTATADPPQTTDTARKLAAKQWVEDRRALSAVVNGLFSVGGVSFAAWYAAGSAGWRDEWRALVALFAGLLVAASEGVLFVISQDRAEKRRAREKARREGKARLRAKPEEKGNRSLMDNDSEKAAGSAETKLDTPVSDSEQKPAQITVDKADSSPLEPDDLIPSGAAEEHPTLRRRAPPAGVTQSGSEDT